METSSHFQSIRNEICNWLYLVTAVCSVPVFFVGLLRANSIGWHWTGVLQTVFPVLALVFLAFRNSIPYSVRAGFIVFLCMVLGLFGMARFGLLAAAIPATIIAPGLAVILFGFRVGVYVVVITLSVVSLIATGKIYGVLQSNFDPEVYVRLVPSWALFILSSFISMAVLLTAIVKLVTHLTAALELSAKNRDQLEALVAQRTQELEKAKTEAESLARTDPLTGINNRRAFYELAGVLDEQARRSELTYTVLMIDIDHFKLINDKWGHLVGDNVLALVSDLIVRVVRSSDIVARLGGEEFAVMLPDTDFESGRKLGEKLRKTIEHIPIQAPSDEIKITVSVGVAMIEPTTTSFGQVVSRADAALYHAKRNGRNRVCGYQGEIIS